MKSDKTTKDILSTLLTNAEQSIEATLDHSSLRLPGEVQMYKKFIEDHYLKTALEILAELQVPKGVDITCCSLVEKELRTALIKYYEGEKE